jgi:spoIIIJ-associated protein
VKMIESQGKTLEEAIENGLNQLGLAREDTDITVLDEATKGFLGFGARPARVLLTEKLRRVNQAAEAERIARENKENREREDELRRQREEAREAHERIKAEKAEKAEKVERAERKTDGRPVRSEKAEKVEKPERSTRTATADPLVVRGKKEALTDSNRNERSGKGGQKRPAQAKALRQAMAKDARPSREKAFLQGQETDLSREAKEYLENLLRLMGVNIEISSVETENGLYIDASGPDAGTLIGYRGETLDALQYLVSLKVNKGEEDYQRVSLDAEDYRAKREDILIKLAQRLATKAVKTGRKVSLEPMNPYERRILHSALQGHTGVRTHSEGSDPYRRVVITPKSAQRKSQGGSRSGRQRAEDQPMAEAEGPSAE